MCALNVGRSLGQGLAIVDSAVRGYHVYKDVWKPAIGEKLHPEQERDNAVDKFAMKVVKNNERFLVCWCLVVRIKLKLIARKTLKDTNGSFRSHHSMKKSMNYSNTLSVSFMFTSWHLEEFYEY